MFDVTNTANPFVWILWLGLVVLVGALIYLGMRPIDWRTRRWGIAIAGVILAVGLLGGLVVPFAAQTTGGSTPAPSGATAISTVQTATFVTGETFLANTNTIQVDIVYNSTGHVFCVEATNATCAATAHTYVNIPFKLSRSDTINATYGFNAVVNSIFTLTPSGATTAYSPIAYTAASSTSGGVWQMKWSAGSLAGAFPSQQNAPTVATGVAPDLVGVGAFGGTSLTLGITLGGANSTSGNFINGATIYNTYSCQIVFSGGGGVTPASDTVSFLLLGIHA